MGELWQRVMRNLIAWSGRYGNVTGAIRARRGASVAERPEQDADATKNLGKLDGHHFESSSTERQAIALHVT